MTFEVFVKFQELEEMQVPFVNFTYNLASNIGSPFRIVFPVDILRKLIPGMDIRISWNRVNVFSGRLDIMDQDTDTTVSFNGVDEMGKQKDRLINYSSAAAGSPYAIEEVETSEMVARLLKAYTGRTATDSEYNITEYVTPSTIRKKWKFNNSTLQNAIIELANSSSVSTKYLGFSAWFDGSKKLHFNPLGQGTYHKDIVYDVQKMTFDNTSSANQITFIGSTQPVAPADRDDWTENQTASISGGSDPWNRGGAYNTITLATPALAAEHSTKGAKAIRLAIAVTANLGECYAQFALIFSRITGDFIIGNDWSDGEGTDPKPPIRRPTSLEGSDTGTGNLILDYIEFRGKWSSGTDGTGVPNWNIGGGDSPPVINVFLVTNGGALTWARESAGEPPDEWIQCSEMSPSSNQGANEWRRYVFHPKPETTEASVDVTDVDALIIEARNVTAIPNSPASNTAYLWIDNLVFHYSQIKAISRDTDSIARSKIRDRSFSNRNINDWKTGWSISKSILSRMKKTLVMTDVTTPFNPKIQINDLVNVRWRGRQMTLIVRGLSVSSDRQLSLLLGNDRPDIVAIVAAFRALEVKDQEGGKGYKLQETFEDDRCYQLCETQCEQVCLLDNNQTHVGILTTAGVSTLNPCQENCETYVEIDV